MMFEAHPRPSRRDTQLEWATLLSADLRQIPGFDLGNEKALVSSRANPKH